VGVNPTTKTNSDYTTDYHQFPKYLGVKSRTQCSPSAPIPPPTVRVSAPQSEMLCVDTQDYSEKLPLIPTVASRITLMSTDTGMVSRSLLST